MRCGRMRCGDIWRCGGPKKKELLSYEELIALATHTDIINELNTHPEEYFNKYNSEGHILIKYGANNLANIGAVDPFRKDNYRFYYNSTDVEWNEIQEV